MDTVEVERGVVEVAARRVRGTDLRLSPLEVRLLVHLAERPGEVISRERLLVEVWGLPAGSSSRTVFATVERLRKKLERDPTRPRHVLTVGRSGYTFRPLGAAPAPAATPTPGDGFVGRRDELAAVERWFRGARGRALVVVGPGGVGKTRLVVESARRFAERWVLVDVSRCEGPHDLVDALGRALDLPLGGQDLRRALARLGRVAVAGRWSLLLDGGESAEGLPALLAAWPEAVPRPLITSRGSLGADEELLRLEPLPCPSGTEPSDATELFVARSAAVGGAAGQDGEVAELVRLLEGSPLAIELAARWCSLFTPGELVRRLRTARLVLEGADRPERQRSLEATVRWSWDLLTAGEQDALAAFAVFRGGFDVEAAEGVLGGTPADLARLERLVDRSLVRRARVGDGFRFSLPDPVRGFALARLRASPEAWRSAHARHAATIARFASDAQLALLDRAPVTGVRHGAQDELADLELAAEAEDAEVGARCALVAAVALRRAGRVDRAEPLLVRARSRDGLAAPLRVRLADALGNAWSAAGRVREASAVLAEAEALARAEAPELLGMVLSSRGTFFNFHGSPRDAREALEQASAAFLARGDGCGAAIATAELAHLAVRSGHPAEAIRLYQEALPVLRAHGARLAEAIYLGNLGVAAYKSRRWDAARANLLASRDLHRELGTRRFDALTANNLGLVEEACGRFAEAAEGYRASIRVAVETGDERSEAIALANLGGLSLVLGDTVAARAHLAAAERTLSAGAFHINLADVHLTTAALERAEGDPDAAEARLAAARALIARFGFGELAVRELAQRGLCALARGDREAAGEAERRAGEAVLALAGGAAVQVLQDVERLREALARP